jgi:hypothetical protein|tara:strand:+ start:119 stop:724 length:606 start_codon:yes stop_codon:yes gene_type:complete
MGTYTDIRYDYNLPAGFGGALKLIKEQTASSSASISFVDGTSDVVLDSTYRTYIFKFINIHPATNNAKFAFNLSIDGGSNYNVTKTTTMFRASHDEDDSGTSFGYVASQDLAQSTDFQNILQALGDNNDSSGSGELFLFSPSSTTFVKHFIARGGQMQENGKALDGYVAGYGNTTSAVDAVQFKMSSGNIDSGVIKLYGIV